MTKEIEDQVANKAETITQEECDAVASLYERIMKSFRINKLKYGDQHEMWKSLEAYFESREPKFARKIPLPDSWHFGEGVKCPKKTD